MWLVIKKTMNGIPKEYHGAADFAYVPAVWMAPKLAGFEEEQTAATICRVFSTVDLAYTLCTDARWGIVKAIPYKTHAALDVLAGLAAFPIPWIINKSENKAVRNTFLAMGVIGVVVGTLSLIGGGFEPQRLKGTKDH